MSTLKKTHGELLRDQTKIILDRFNMKKSTMETVIRKKSECFTEKRNIIMLYKNKQEIYKQLTIQLEHLNTYTEYYINGKESY